MIFAEFVDEPEIPAVGPFTWRSMIRQANSSTGCWEYRPVGNPHYAIDGKEVTKEEFDIALKLIKERHP